MTKKLFNSRHEISYRILLLLSTCKERKLSIDRIAALDFITIYGVDFGVSEENLHGMNSFRFSEYAGRRYLISEGIKALVISGYVQFYPHRQGFLYRISEEGLSFCGRLCDDYAKAYVANASQAVSFSKKYSDRKLAKIICDYSILISREG